MEENIKSLLKFLGVFGMARHIFWSIWEKRQFHRMIRFYSRFIHPGDIVFDVGVNIGNRTRIFNYLGATIVAIEPEEVSRRKLEDEVRNRDAVIICDHAIGESMGEAEFYICESEPTLSTLSTKWKETGRFASVRHWTKVKKIP